jgi:serine/threonine-protein kinase
MLTYASPSELTTLLGGPAIEHSPALSPDDRWLAYVLVENGSQLFVRPFPNVNEARIPISTGTGTVPVWSRDGRQLFFTQSGEVMMTRVESVPSIRFGRPELFIQLRESPIEPIRVALPPVNGRILKTVAASKRPSGSTEYRVVLNWAEELKTRVKTP